MNPRDLARKALEIAEANPDHIYEQPTLDDGYEACAYVDPRTLEGSCLFGRAFLALGVTPEDLLEVNTLGICSALDVDVNSPEYGLLANAQGLQDVGIPWGAEPAGYLRKFLEQA